MKKKIFYINEYKNIKEENGDFYITGYANNKNVADDYGDIPKGNCVYDLERYNKNPVILADHNSSVENIIGTMVFLKEDSLGLKFKALFMKNPKSEIASHAIQAIKENHLRSLSIGGQWFYEDKKNPHILTKAKIYEISFVSIPADSNALTDSSLPKKSDNFNNKKKIRRSLMNIENFIKKKVFQNNKDSEIFEEVLEIYKDVSPEKISEEIYKNKKIKKIEDDLEKRYKNEENEKKMDEKFKNIIDNKINEKLKTININELNKFKLEKKLKKFNPITKKFEDRIVNNECLGQFNNMLRLISEGDKVNAKAISKEIDQENKNINLNTFKTVTSDNGVAGGFAIPTEVNQEIMQLEYEQSAMLPNMYRDSIIYQDKVYPLMNNISASYIQNQNTALTESDPNFHNPTIHMQRIGLWTNMSNTIIRQKGIDLTQAFSTAISSAFSSFLDQQIVTGSITGHSDLVDGILFDSNTMNILKTSFSNFSINNLKDLKNSLDKNINIEKTFFICNSIVADKIGLLKSGDSYIFNGYIEGRKIKPFGIPIIINKQIDSTISISGETRDTGSSDILICADLSKVIIGLSEIRIDESPHFNFTKDVTTFRALRNYGQKVLMCAGDLGTVSCYQELT